MRDFHTSVRSWLVRTISQRDLLVKRGDSRKNSALMVSNIQHLRKYLNAYRYNSDEKMAKFFYQNRDRIFSLLPGKGSSAHEKRILEYNEFLTKSKQILFNYEDLHIHMWPDKSRINDNRATV